MSIMVVKIYIRDPELPFPHRPPPLPVRARPQVADSANIQQLVDIDIAMQGLLSAPLALPRLARHDRIGRGGEGQFVPLPRRHLTGSQPNHPGWCGTSSLGK
jgi:hypothetical protein